MAVPNSPSFLSFLRAQHRCSEISDRTEVDRRCEFSGHETTESSLPLIGPLAPFALVQGCPSHVTYRSRPHQGLSGLSRASVICSFDSGQMHENLHLSSRVAGAVMSRPGAPNMLIYQNGPPKSRGCVKPSVTNTCRQVASPETLVSFPHRPPWMRWRGSRRRRRHAHDFDPPSPPPRPVCSFSPTIGPP